MRYRDLLEGVVANGPVELAAFAVAVAEAYEAAPVHDKTADVHWQALRNHTVEVLFKRVRGSGVRISFTPDDPYGDLVGTDDPKMMIRYMLYDMVFNKRLQIYSGHSSSHPTFSEHDNWIFRTVHDYFTHGTLRKNFEQSFLRAFPDFDGEEPSPEMLKQILPNVSLSRDGNKGFGFNARGELNAASRHIRLAPKAATPALYTEIVGQVCFQRICGDFPPQKVAVLQGFDYMRLGQTIAGSAADVRKREVLEMIRTKQPVIDLAIKSCPKIETAELVKRMTAEA